jgi:YebC/PmpR family DNA-binding regulatory protein
MAGHNKWKQIKHQKAKTDAQKSKIFTKYARLISVEAKKVHGDMASPSLIAVIEKAKKENVPKDVIERAVKKSESSGAMESISYEAYGPGGCAMIIEALTENRNKAAQEVKHILSKHGFALAGMGAASWAFTRNPDGTWTPNSTMDLSDEDLAILDALVDELDENDEVQEVFTNVA